VFFFRTQSTQAAISNGAADALLRMMSIILAKNWWSLVMRGLAAILLGLITVIWPGITLGALVRLFFAYALFDGLVAIAGAVRAAEESERWWWALLLEGIAGVATAIITMVWTAITALTLVYIISTWAFITGIFEIAAAFRLRRYVSGEWLLALSGFASLILGMLMVTIPLATPLPVAAWIGAYGFIFGALLIGLGFRLRSWTKKPATDSRYRSINWQRG
jgi:uncharacterized membrane protein HdeD (DUF308 family)